MKKIIYTLGIFIILTSSLFSSEGFNILKKSFNYTKGFTKYSLHVLTEEKEIQEDGKIFTFKYISEIKIDRPSKLLIETKSDTLERKIYLNKGKYKIFDKGNDFYEELNTPINIDDALDKIFNHYDIKEPLAALIYSDMLKRLKFDKVKFLGTKKIKNKVCNKLYLKNKDMEIYLLISKSKKPLILRYATKDLKTNKETAVDISWDFSKKIEDSDFIFPERDSLRRIDLNQK